MISFNGRIKAELLIERMKGSTTLILLLLVGVSCISFMPSYAQPKSTKQSSAPISYMSSDLSQISYPAQNYAQQTFAPSNYAQNYQQSSKAVAQQQPAQQQSYQKPVTTAGSQPSYSKPSYQDSYEADSALPFQGSGGGVPSKPNEANTIIGLQNWIKFGSYNFINGAKNVVAGNANGISNGNLNNIIGDGNMIGSLPGM